MDITVASSLAVVVGALVINGLTTLAKHFNIPSKYALVGAALLASIGYTAFTMYIPVDIQSNVLAFGTSAVGTAVLVYEFLLKQKQ